MKEFLVIAVMATVAGGTVELTPDQYRRRKHLVEVISEPEGDNLGVYKILKPLNFKAGEVVRYDGPEPHRMQMEAIETESEDDTGEVAVNVEDMTVVQLKANLDDREIEYRSDALKADLVMMVIDAQEKDAEEEAEEGKDNA